MIRHRVITAIVVSTFAAVGTAALETNLMAQPSQPNIRKHPPRTVTAISQAVENEVVVGIRQKLLPPKSEIARRGEDLKTIGLNLSRDFHAELIAIYPAMGFLRLRIPPGFSMPKFIEKLKADDRVEYVTPNYRGILHNHNSVPPPQPNDYYWQNDFTGPPSYSSYAYLWGLDKIEIKKAWGIYPGGQAIVAVVDSGIDYDHPDLKGNTINGVNIIYESTTKMGLPNDCRDSPQPDPKDTDGHGTMVAGTVGALGNNQKFIDAEHTNPDFQTAIVGVNPGVKLMPIKITCVHQGSAFEEPYLTDAIAGVEYAVRNNASVIVGSWGIYGGSLLDENVKKLRQVILDAKDTTLYIASAGNEDIDIDGCVIAIWPQRFGLENEIVVAATDPSDTLWVKIARPATGSAHCDITDGSEGSNYGKSVDIAAPGDDEMVYSVAAGGGQRDVAAYGGTSAAAPHVAGCAALLQAHRAITNPSSPFLPKDLKNILMTAGDSISGLQVVSGNRLNCYNALNESQSMIQRLRAWFRRSWDFIIRPHTPGPDPAPHPIEPPASTGKGK